MPIANNYPTVAPSLLLDFANTKQLDPRITFSRPTTATYYDCNTSALAEQNLLLWSQDFENNGWGKSGVSVTANTTVAPDGTTTADTVTADGTTGSKTISASNMGLVAAPPTARTVSVYAKAGTNNFLQITFSGDATPWANYDLSTGTVGSTGTNQTASILPAGDGWYRCVLYTPSTTATTLNFAIISSSSAVRNESNSLATTVQLWASQLERRSSVTAYTPTTTAPITNFIPVLLTAPLDTPRFDHNPVTRESLGLEIEEQRTNLFQYSQEFDNPAWFKVNCSIQANVLIAPDGTLTADKFVEDSQLNSRYVALTSGWATIGTTYAFSVQMKAAERQWAYIGPANEGNKRAWFNLSTGTIGTVSSGVVSASMQPVGNGWYRCTVVFTAGVTNPFPSFSATNANGAVSYQGDGYSGIYIFGSQLEAGSFPTSYIPTVASQVTRSADSASMTGANFSSWYNISEGTIYGEALTNGYTSAGAIAYFRGGSAEDLTIRYLPTNSMNGQAATYGVTQASMSPAGTYLNGTFNKIAMAVATNNFAISANGSSVVADTLGVLPAADRVVFGAGINLGSQYLNGYIKKIAYYPVRVTNTQLQALTGS